MRMSCPSRWARRSLRVWLWMAWANGRGHGWARVLFVGFFGLTSVSLLSAFGQHAATYAPADLIAGCAVWLVGLVTMLLIFNPQSDRHYSQRRPNRRADREPHRGGLAGTGARLA